MRDEPTEAEEKCWQFLRDRRFEAFKFRRQLPFGPYIVDFVCLSARLVIELDGSQHAESTYDVVRDAYIVRQGFRIFRFWNDDILRDPGPALDAIWHALAPYSVQAQPYTPYPQD